MEKITLDDKTIEKTDFEKIKTIIIEGEEEIVDKWSKNVQKQINAYKEIPREIIKANMKRNLDCIVAYLDDNIIPTDSLIKDIAFRRANMNFKIVAVTRAVLIGREIIHNYLFDQYENYTYKQIKKIDNWFFYTIITHAEMHAHYLEERREKNGSNKEDSYIKEYLEELKKLF